MILYRIPHGEFVGGMVHTNVSPSITTSSFNENNFIVNIKKIDETADKNNQASDNTEGRSLRTTEESVLCDGNITDPVGRDGKRWGNSSNVPCRKAILTRERTEYGREMRNKYDSHQVGFCDNMKTRNPRKDGLSNTITSFATDNLVLIVRRYDDRWKKDGTPSSIGEG